MSFVVDASVAICWLMPDERDPVAETAVVRIAREPAIVPDIWWFEIRNALIVCERRGRLDRGMVGEALRLLESLPIKADAEIDETALLHLARTHKLTVYDAAYLELAKRKDLPLATLDKALEIAARAEAVELIEAGRRPG